MALEIDRAGREPFMPPLGKPVEPPAAAPISLDPVLLGPTIRQMSPA